MSGFYERRQRSEDVEFRLLKDEVQRKAAAAEGSKDPKKNLKQRLESIKPSLMIFNVNTPTKKSRGDHVVRIVTLKQMLEDTVDNIVDILKLKSSDQKEKEHRLEGVTFPGFNNAEEFLKEAIQDILKSSENKTITYKLQFNEKENELERKRNDDGTLMKDNFILLETFIKDFKEALVKKQKEAEVGKSNFADDDDDDESALTQFMNWALGSLKPKNKEPPEPPVVNTIPKIRRPRTKTTMSKVAAALEELQEEEVEEEVVERDEKEEGTEQRVEEQKEEGTVQQEEVQQPGEQKTNTREWDRKDARNLFSKFF